MIIWLDQVYDYLRALGVAGTVPWPIYEGYLADDQDQMVAIFSSGGDAFNTLLGENRTVRMQLRVRAARQDFQTAYTKWKQCFDALSNAREGTLPSYLVGFRFIVAKQLEPLTFTDENGRTNLTSNWEIMLDN